MRHHRTSAGRRRSTPHSDPPPSASAALLVLLAMAVAGYFILRSKPPPGRPLCLLIDFDVSRSQNPEERERLCGVMDETLNLALPARSRVVLWSFDRQVRKVFDKRPQQARDLWRMQDESLIPVSQTSLPGTSPAEALEENLEEARRSEERGERVALMLLWDGEDFDPARTQKLVSQLAQLPHLRAVWVAGVTTESRHDLRAQVERTFEPLGSQLIVSGPYDTQDGLESFRQALKGEE